MINKILLRKLILVHLIEDFFALDNFDGNKLK